MPEIADSERALSIAYAPRESRPALAALWALDERLGDIVRTTSEPVIGRMRLTWWHEALGVATPPAEPLLEAVRAALADLGALLPLIDGWEILLDPLPLIGGRLDDYAKARGETLFDVAAVMLGGELDDAGRSAGRGWALTDLAFHVSDRATAEIAIAKARIAFGQAPRRWPKRLRAVGMLAKLAERDARAGLGAARRPGSPSRLLRSLRHRLTGR